MEKIKTLVVDDEPLALELVKEYVELTPFLELVDCCQNASQALEYIDNGSVQLIFLDVQMPGISGISLTKSLSGANKPKVIFTTAFSQYAVEGFHLDAVDYILKPFDYGEFMRSANKARDLIEMEIAAKSTTDNAKLPDNDFFFVKSDYKLVRIDKQNIIHIEGLKDYVKIYVSNNEKPILTLMSLKQMEQQLLQPNFIRVHRSFIINVKFITGIERNLIHLTRAKVPMGDSYKQQMMDIIERYTI